MPGAADDRPLLPSRQRRGRRLRGLHRRGTAGPQGLSRALAALLESMGGSRERAGLQQLWDNWEAALGVDLAALARPLGHKAPRQKDAGAILLISADDAMLLQELSLRSCEILERVNGFLGHAHFAEVKVSLALGRREPERSRAQEEVARGDEAVSGPVATGLYLEGMDQASPVARCYARFAQRKLILEKGLDPSQEESDEK